jgi:hypothetical protein
VPGHAVGVGEHAVVVGPRHPGEHTGPGALEGRGIDPGLFDGLPRHLQQHPLLRVHRQGLARADPEEVGVEPRRVGQEAARAAPVRAQGVEVPAAVVGQRGDALAAGAHQPPQLRGVAGTGVPAGQAHDHDRIGGSPRGGEGRTAVVVAQQGEHDAHRCRVVEDERAGLR